MQDLASYIQNLLKKGYDVNSIKKGLLRYGYPEKAIDQTIYNLNKTNNKFHLTKTSIIAIAVILVISLSIALFFMFRTESSPEKIMDISIEPISNEFSPGEFLTSSFTLTKIGSREEYKVYMKYEIFNEADNKRIEWKSEEIALESTKTQDIIIQIPKDTKDGNYILQVTARYNADSPKASSTFKIKSSQNEPSCSDRIKNGVEEGIDCGGQCKKCKKCPDTCNDNNPLTIDYCDSSTNFECKNEQPAKCGDNICSDTENANTCPDDCKEPDIPQNNVWEELEKIKETAKNNCEKAKQECDAIDKNYKDKCLQNIGEICQNPETCDKIENSLEKDSCFANVAKALNKPALCENINKESRRDSCYVNFAIDGDYTVCDKVTNTYLQKSCNTLRQASQ